MSPYNQNPFSNWSPTPWFTHHSLCSCNNFDEHLIPNVPARKAITLRGRIEGSVREQRILPDANIGALAFHPINIVFNNTQPRLDPIVATDSSGRRVKVATPGQTVFLSQHSSDKDGDRLKFRWEVAAGSGTLSAKDTPKVEWRLPAAPGLYSVKLIARTMETSLQTIRRTRTL